MARVPTPIGSRLRGRHFAAPAAVLSKAVAAGDLEAVYALRVLRHQLRLMNVNAATRAVVRSKGAQEVIDRYAATGMAIPKNGSNDVLHSDHVHPITAKNLSCLVTREAWLAELVRLTEVVCVTAAENYRLEQVERKGNTGWSKYDVAGISLIRPSANTSRANDSFCLRTVGDQSSARSSQSSKW